MYSDIRAIALEKSCDTPHATSDRVFDLGLRLVPPLVSVRPFWLFHSLPRCCRNRGSPTPAASLHAIAIAMAMRCYCYSITRTRAGQGSQWIASSSTHWYNGPTPTAMSVILV